MVVHTAALKGGPPGSLGPAGVSGYTLVFG
jgi:hypothetical protein